MSEGTDPVLSRLFTPKTVVHAHCDLPCGVYDPAQARIEAESIKMIIQKVGENSDADFRTRAILIKEQRAELVKHHLWVLWTDYFKPPHFEKYLRTAAGILRVLVSIRPEPLAARGSPGTGSWAPAGTSPCSPAHCS